MQLTATALSILTTFFGLTTALPTNTYANTHANRPRDTAPVKTLLPSSIANFDIGTGEIGCDATIGFISRYAPWGGNDISTLVTFTFPSDIDFTSKTCQLQFSLWPEDSVAGTAQVDLFSSLAPADCTSGSEKDMVSNQRGAHLGRLAVSPGMLTRWISNEGGSAAPCPPAGSVLGYELAPVGDEDGVEWDATTAKARGLFLQYY
ncbi:hypothetical protein B0T26DRAFT_683086 [Lasiosphaeria miniovina]|uniref:Ubiquitin 3 binding protein But2 C-terminal domain-containing protein n=1 Tax=Lasiosphaeria miniovina TaxID=1954250 RepID=A0AA40ECG0_9PEZI|nr:uncharacterized protein B0T26DRAFT_683086 [Lasiosphaeria miniovina]KAK0733192.1 hypothetical protein B0T26DRAFT_683086 [Lasiosphaeria miniovina]